MAIWGDVERDEPDLARRVRARFDETGLALVGTFRADGAPRVSGWEPLFHGGHIWLGSMPGSRKNDDLRRDPRIALHNARATRTPRPGTPRSPASPSR